MEIRLNKKTSGCAVESRGGGSLAKKSLNEIGNSQILNFTWDYDEEAQRGRIALSGAQFLPVAGIIGLSGHNYTGSREL